jgi:hypothetical protein
VLQSCSQTSSSSSSSSSPGEQAVVKKSEGVLVLDRSLLLLGVHVAAEESDTGGAGPLLVPSPGLMCPGKVAMTQPLLILLALPLQPFTLICLFSFSLDSAGTIMISARST